MIKLIIGGIGSGKTISAVKSIIDRKIPAFTNFPIDYKFATRLKEEHIVNKEVSNVTKTGKETYKYNVNWEFWRKEQQNKFDIYLDEVHNMLSSRRSISSWNVNVSKWLSQIRKLLGSNKHNHLYLITQRLYGIDVTARELAGEIIYLRGIVGKRLVPTAIVQGGRLKTKMLPETYIIKHYFRGEECLDKFEMFKAGHETDDSMSYFLANPYYRFYDTYDIVEFGESVYV